MKPSSSRCSRAHPSTSSFGSCSRLPPASAKRSSSAGIFFNSSQHGQNAPCSQSSLPERSLAASTFMRASLPSFRSPRSASSTASSCIVAKETYAPLSSPTPCRIFSSPSSRSRVPSSSVTSLTLDARPYTTKVFTAYIVFLLTLKLRESIPSLAAPCTEAAHRENRANGTRKAARFEGKRSAPKQKRGRSSVPFLLPHRASAHLPGN